MHTCLTINHTKASRSQLAHYLQRTGWLNLGQAGSFTGEMLAHLTSGNYAPVFLRLPDPDTELPESFLVVLRQHRGLIITSPYPQHLYGYLALQPFDFLTEPFSFERFAGSLERYVERFG
ncbi:hypothetical protein [Arsenicibacter rosenii]|uniref:Uncharacterized protein n=1 Tax=Arsenicibacter rosenii TaxID=1750698 RepID=A0A1S2V9U7_9BACT|nr:hypothetical protein [Arsenicibacter rosenii]OIN55452.1 hypothetical protein BLX24_30550 [Arsenicibacter rosenii]